MDIRKYMHKAFMCRETTQEVLTQLCLYEQIVTTIIHMGISYTYVYVCVFVYVCIRMHNCIWIWLTTDVYIWIHMQIMLLFFEIISNDLMEGCDHSVDDLLCQIKDEKMKKCMCVLQCLSLFQSLSRKEKLWHVVILKVAYNVALKG